MRQAIPVFALSLFGLSMLGCSAFLGNEGDQCASHGDCDEALYCAGPDAPQVCGIPPRTECASVSDCATGLACHAISDPCSADGQGSECGIPCTATSCQPGFACGGSGNCEAIICGENSCGPLEVCDPAQTNGAPVYDQTDGCRAITCANDNECPEAGQCVNGVCQSGPGMCRENVAVP